MTRKLFSVFNILMISLFMIGCTGRESTRAAVDNVTDTETESEGRTSTTIGYLEKFEGLHVTGTVIDIDIDSYRLKVTGAVENELSLTFDDVKAYESKVVELELNCPGFFTDKGDWTGVPLTTLLEEAGMKDDASSVTFVSYDNSYSQILAYGRIMEGDILVTYQFDGKELHKVHGFPLRICAPGEAGAVWVKWLGEIRVQ